MTDANGFYRPRGLPHDIEFEDDEDSRKSVTESTASVSEYTVSSRPSSEVSYLFPDRHTGRRTPVSMSDYGYNNVYTPPPPPSSQYTPPPASQYNPPAPEYTPPVSLYTPPSSTHTAPGTPLLPTRLPPSDHVCCSRYGTTTTAPTLPLTIHDPPFPRHHCCTNSKFRSKIRKLLLRTSLLTLLLVLIILWKTHHLLPFRSPPRILSSSCAPSKTAFATQGTYTLTPSSSFTFTESASIGLGGNILVRTDETAKVVTVEYDILSSAPDTVSFSVSSSTNTVELRAPHSSSCITARITLTLPPSLQTLILTTSTLPINLDSSVSLSTLKLISHHDASLTSYASVNKSTTISLSSGSITGTFDLAEHLTLSTLAGSIAAKIHPLNITAPTASLVAKTLSGSITLGLKLDDPSTPPKRNYTTVVSTVSGSITGKYLFGFAATFGADAGAIAVSLWPMLFGEGEKMDTLVTGNQHGATVVSFEKALGGKRVCGFHGAITGGVEVRYPKDWEGEVKAKTRVGVVEVTGEGVEITKRSLTEVEGFKGDKEKGKIVAGTEVGEVIVRVG
ncbi:hypothetical protein BDD12DRAFT_829228 [Trichophaea hybrida]|nr:hypothetical protein BDD12DRAFT_829228 [Trichophaea hybrida]